jgi:phosphohistidine phosphatase
MKTLILVRHAKSSWPHEPHDDFDRPLNERGHRDAPEMARRLMARDLTVDLLVSSPARRAKKTAAYFADVLGFEKSAVVLISELYHPRQEVFSTVVNQLPDTASTVAIFSHNPGITDFINTLAEVRIDHVPTCAVFAVSANVNRWNDFLHQPGQFLFFDYPKAG